jgi:hypothetical protein
MPWYAYLLLFLSGLLLANGVPHFVQGISGATFQSPFGKPPGVGESSPLSNVLWGFLNLLIGGLLLLWAHKLHWPNPLCGWGAVALGVLVAGIGLAIHFGKVRGSAPR